MTLVLIDLRSVCVFALRNNMLNGKMCSIGGCKRTQAWHPHNIYNISIKAVSPHLIMTASMHGFPFSPIYYSCFCCRSMITLSICCTCSMTAKKARSSDWTAQKMCTSLPGFEPGIFWSVVRRVIRCATSPVLETAIFSLYKPLYVSDLLFQWREIWMEYMSLWP